MDTSLQVRAQQNYKAWLHDPCVDPATKAELQGIAHRTDEIMDRFYKELEFGTGGLRGIIGAGSNRMNMYTVGKCTQGLARYLSEITENPSVVIAYDSRHFSAAFALEAAQVLAGNGIKTYLFAGLRPTPQLSFAVRQLQASAGIVITASHNPPEYNGYKVYGNDGGQITVAVSSRVIAHIRDVASFTEIHRVNRVTAEEQGLLVWLGVDMDEAYLSAVTQVSPNATLVQKTTEQYRIVYTPLHGTGNLPVRNVLQRIGFQHVHVVPEQELPDPNFSTVKFPNPEEQASFTLAITQAQRWNADLIIGTDPDADRMGAVVKDTTGAYIALTGNQAGALMLYYLLEAMKQQGTLPENGLFIKTIVTSEFGASIAQSYGVAVLNTLTGFKYIGEKMTALEQTGDYRFIFGYEESYGYLAGNYARDKDAVAAAMLISEAGAHYKALGKTLYEVLQQLYAEHGYYLEGLQSRTLEGAEGAILIDNLMNHWRVQAPNMVSGVRLVHTEDFIQGLYELPPENVLKFHLEDKSWFCLRPSGTEPKLKVYVSVKGTSYADAQTRLQRITDDLMSIMDTLLASQK